MSETGGGDVYSEVYDAVRDHEHMNDPGAPTETVVEELCEVGSRPEELVRDAIDRLDKRGEIYSPDGGDHYRITDRANGVA